MLKGKASIGCSKMPTRGRQTWGSYSNSPLLPTFPVPTQEKAGNPTGGGRHGPGGRGSCRFLGSLKNVQALLAAELGWGKGLPSEACREPTLTQAGLGDQSGRAECLKSGGAQDYTAENQASISQSHRKGPPAVCLDQARGTVAATALCPHHGPAQSASSFSWGS